MMRKFLAFALALSMLLAMTACGGSATTPQQGSGTGETETGGDGAEQWGEAENTWLSCISSNLLDGEHPFYKAQVFFDHCLRE